MRPTTARVFARLAAALAAAVIVFAAVPRAQPARGPVTLGVANATNAHVSLAARGAVVVAAWAASTKEGATDIFAAVSRDSGATFGNPIRVSGGAGAARVNGEQPPRVTLAGGGPSSPDIVIMWTAAGERGTRLLTSRSRDGLTFSAETLVPGTDSAGNRGWEAVASTGSATYAVWLDHRQLAGPAADQGHQHGQPTTTPRASGDGVAMAQRSQLYFAALGAVDTPRALTGGVCYCCKTAMATSGARTIFLAWRHVYPGNLRDIAFTASRDGGRTFAPPVRVSEDRWAINGCPDDGPAMAVDGKGRVHVVWPTVVAAEGGAAKALFHAMSADGRSFGARTRIPTEAQPNHPQVTIGSDGAVWTAWDEARGGQRVVQSARTTVDGSGNVKFESLSSPGAGSYPVLTATRSSVLRAWTAPDGRIYIDRP